MNPLRWIAGKLGIGRARVAAKYDAAQTTAQNRNHWSQADSLAAVSANSPAVRQTLRNRSRYETGNNGFLRGMSRTLANDCVGKGPVLQVRTPSQQVNDVVERAWAEWSEAVGLAQKLRTMRKARMVDGEAFALMTTNRRLPTRIKLDVKLIEADQVENPTLQLQSELANGIRFDEDGNPLTYFILKTHPGDQYAPFSPLDYDEVSADQVLHYFEPDRVGEIRGVPELTSTLSLGADGRRYRNAVVAAAETAANMATVIQTQAAPDTGAGSPPAATPYDVVNMPRNGALVLPDGYTIGQAKPEQPTTSHAQFNRELIVETARPVGMPYNVAAGDSSGYNYASGRLDHQTYHTSVDVEQDLLRVQVLERVFRAWLREAATGMSQAVSRERLGDAVRSMPIAHQWLWPGSEHVDPEKEANAQTIRLNNGTTTRTRELAREGIDVDAHEREQLREGFARLDQIKQLIDHATKLGIPNPEQVAIAIAMPEQSAPVASSDPAPEPESSRGPMPMPRDQEMARVA